MRDVLVYISSGIACIAEVGHVCLGSFKFAASIQMFNQYQPIRFTSFRQPNIPHIS